MASEWVRRGGVVECLLNNTVVWLNTGDPSLCDHVFWGDFLWFKFLGFLSRKTNCIIGFWCLISKLWRQTMLRVYSVTV